MAKRTEVIKKLGEGLAKPKDYTETIWKFANLKANIKILLGNRKKRLTHYHIRNVKCSWTEKRSLSWKW